MGSYADYAIIGLLLVVICQRGIKLSSIRRIEKKMSELSDAVAEIANDVTELQQAQQRVIDILTKPNPDVAAAVDALRTADAGFDAIRDALNSVGAEPGGGETPTP